MKLPKQILICAMIALFCNLSALEVQVVEFQSTADSIEAKLLDSDEFSQTLFQKLAARDLKGLIGFRSRKSGTTGGIIASELDALKACEIHGWETLVYGLISAKNYGYDLEVRIYSHPERAVQKTFLLRAASDDLDEMIDDAASRVYGYFADSLRIRKEQDAFIPEGDSLIVSQAIEWWGMTPPWNASVTAIAGYDGRIGFRAGTPLWTDGNWAWYREFGFTLAYHFGTGQSGSLDANIHDFDLGPYLSWAFVRQRKTELVATVTPCAKIHVLQYRPLYDSTTADARVWYGLKLDAEYRFWLNAQRNLAMGLRVGAGSFLANPAYLEYRVGASFVWKGLTK